jgi:hypothetical protein
MCKLYWPLEFAMSSDLQLRQDVLDELEFEPSVKPPISA